MSRKDWRSECEAFVGRTQSQADDLSPKAANFLLATFEDEGGLGPGDALPPLFHWMYFISPVPTANLKADGHEKMGTFLPPVRYPRRMWAGSRVTFHSPLIFGEQGERTSTIRNVLFKSGKSGPLCFVEIEHVLSQNGTACVSDVQTLVYREPGDPVDKVAHSAIAPSEKGWQSLNAITLFRYSALTFNSHRIHYDHDYARDAEGYPGLVVHGPLMATLMMRHAQAIARDRQAATFTFRGLSPLFDNEPFRIVSDDNQEGSELTLSKADGTRCVAAKVTWQSAH